jgi:hypothetical protein
VHLPRHEQLGGQLSTAADHKRPDALSAVRIGRFSKTWESAKMLLTTLSLEGIHLPMYSHKPTDKCGR